MCRFESPDGKPIVTADPTGISRLARDCGPAASRLVGQILTWISDSAGQGAGGHGGRGGQENLRFLVAHAAREIPVGGADALDADCSCGRKCPPDRPGRRRSRRFQSAAPRLFRGLPKWSCRPNRWFAGHGRCRAWRVRRRCRMTTLRPRRTRANSMKSLVLPPVQEPI